MYAARTADVAVYNDDIVRSVPFLGQVNQIL